MNGLQIFLLISVLAMIAAVIVIEFQGSGDGDTYQTSWFGTDLSPLKGESDFMTNGHLDIQKIEHYLLKQGSLTKDNNGGGYLTAKSPNGTKITVHVDKSTATLWSQEHIDATTQSEKYPAAVQLLAAHWETSPGVSPHESKDPKVQESVQQLQTWYSSFLPTLAGSSPEWDSWLGQIDVLIRGPSKGQKLEIPKDPPSWNSIFEWVRYFFMRMGGVAKALKTYRKQIKKSIVEKLTEGYMVAKPTGKLIPSGQCTVGAYFQKCPKGHILSKEVCTQDRSDCTACQKSSNWFSGAKNYFGTEGLCTETTIDCHKGVSPFCFWLGKAQLTNDSLNDAWSHLSPEEQKQAEDSLKKLMAAAAAPILLSASAWTVGTATLLLPIFESFIKEGMKLEPEFDWLVADLLDVCYSISPKPEDMAYDFSSDGGYICQNKGWLNPKYAFDEISDRTCERLADGSLSKNCAQTWSGICKTGMPGPDDGFCYTG